MTEKGINMMNTTTQIPGGNEIRDNNWKEIIQGLNIQPKTQTERLDWGTDVGALTESKEMFIERANMWPSNKRDNNNHYVISPDTGKEGASFYGPLAYSGIRSPYYFGIKFPELKTDEDKEAFAKYTRIIHTYYTNIEHGSLKYDNSKAHMKASMNVALLLATVYSRCDKKLPPIEYSQSDNTMMSEICGLIGKNIDGSDMTDKEQVQFLSDLADDYVAQIEGKGINNSLVANKKSNDKTFGEYKKSEVSDRINNMSAKEKDALLAQFLSQGRD